MIYLEKFNLFNKKIFFNKSDIKDSHKFYKFIDAIKTRRQINGLDIDCEYEDFEKEHKREDFTKNDIEKLKNRLKIKQIITLDNSPRILDSVGSQYGFNCLEFKINVRDFRIFKYSDEWYTICVRDSNRLNYNINPPVYLCDQWDGLIACLEYLKKDIIKK